MPRFGHIIDVLRVAAMWLLVVVVLCGPVGLGGSAAFASVNKACGVSCPCDETHDDNADEHDDHDDADSDHDDAAADSDHDDADPCKDECSNNCPHCCCCMGIAMIVFPLPVMLSRATCTSACMLAPIDAPASGADSDVFRPPRSLI